MNNQETQHLDHEIRKRQYAAIGEMVWRLRPDKLDAAQPEILADIEPLGCVGRWDKIHVGTCTIGQGPVG
ncbi:hypothetical protein [Kushneria aurantia]|uniref:Uncharacterized protein n=1 Tax=Kushneria aurantia TaxID=504092 RepID=A0ABV6G2Q8_9GAMM|nr:hypothetical protein [Kushneria aurantia]